MGEHKHNPPANAVRGQPMMSITDLDSAGEILAKELMYCERCGAPVAMWPPELLREHVLAEHRPTLWDATVEPWETYKNDTDLARRANFLNTYRVNFLITTLQQRRDLYDKLVAAGVIAMPAQG